MGVFSLEIASGVQRAILAEVGSKDLPVSCDLCHSSPSVASAELLARDLLASAAAADQFRSSRAPLSPIFLAACNTELLQLLEDKFDVAHSIRRRFATRRGKKEQPVVLLPLCLRECVQHCPLLCCAACTASIHIQVVAPEMGTQQAYT